MKKTLLLILLLAAGCFMLAACGNGKAPVPDGTAAPTEPPAPATTAAPEPPAGPSYTAETTEFETFTDLKANAALFADLAPVTRSTKGYYEAGDGGAATYRVTRTKPSGVFEKIADGLWAEIETTDPVTPRQFGAYGDGAGVDTVCLDRAVAYAKAHGLLLVLPAGADYYITAPLQLSDVEIRSDGAKISYWGKQQNKPAVNMGSNVTIRGSVTVWAVQNGMVNHGGRCGMAFGVYETGEGASNCYVEEVIVTGGGMPDSNGVLVTGNSHDVRIDRLIVPSGTDVTRGILFHWGNAADHYTVDDGYGHKTYAHKPNWKPSTHPHDCSVGKVVCTDLLAPKGKNDGDNAAVAICACYNITVEEIECSNTYHAVEVTGADMGFEYASDAEKAHGQKNIRIGKITATGLRGVGLYLPGYPWYIPQASAKSDLHFGTVDLSAAPGNTSFGVGLYAVASASFESLTLRGFGGGGMLLANSAKNVTVSQYSFAECGGSAVQVNSPVGTVHNDGNSENLSFPAVTVSSAGGANVPLFVLRTVDGVSVGTVTFTSAGTWSAVAGVYPTASGVTVGTVNKGPATVGPNVLSLS